jgi:hypothetical protein
MRTKFSLPLLLLIGEFYFGHLYKCHVTAFVTNV